VLLFDGQEYTKVRYESLGVVYYPTRFVEGSPPPDAEIVGHTWQYVNKDGGPDRRFSYNPQLALALYGIIGFTLPSNIQIQLYVSNRALAANFAKTFGDILQPNDARQRQSAGSQRRSNSRKNTGGSKGRSTGGQRESSNRKQAPRNNSQSNTSANEVLGVQPDASKAEITAAYRKMAQMYHPDKVAGLGPEFKELAELRMKEINGAYAELSRKKGR
jgi:hypothetical protein